MKDKYYVKVLSTGSMYRVLNGERHCDTGPAVQGINGYKEWWKHGELIWWILGDNVAVGMEALEAL